MSSIELINPKAESVRRSAALQVKLYASSSFPVHQMEVGEHEWRDGPSKCGAGKLGSVPLLEFDHLFDGLIYFLQVLEVP